MLLEELLGEVFATARADRHAGQKNLQADDQHFEENLVTADERRRERRSERRQGGRHVVQRVSGVRQREAAGRRAIAPSASLSSVCVVN